MDVPKDSVFPLIRDFFCLIQDSGINTLTDARCVSVLVDNNYAALKKAEIIGMLNSSPLLVGAAETVDNSELYDCDDYALQLKAALTALFRTKRILTDTISPPAVGIVITQSHALNIVLCESRNAQPEVFLVDPSITSPKLVSDASAAAQLLQTLPLRLIYI